jgi:hypothetical protein
VGVQKQSDLQQVERVSTAQVEHKYSTSPVTAISYQVEIRTMSAARPVCRTAQLQSGASYGKTHSRDMR